MSSQSTQASPDLPKAVRLLFRRAIDGGELELPFLPQTASEVISLANGDDCDARELAELLRRDQSLASHVLRVSNSATYAPKEPIVSLQQAISRLGFQTVCEIAVAVSLNGKVFHVPGHQVRVRRMWMHSATTAFYAREVARSLRRNTEAAFLCGLLHDVGQPVALQALLQAVRAQTERPVPTGIIDATLAVFHEEVGGQVVHNFGLSELLEVVVAHHHDYANAGEYRDEAMIVGLADLLSHWALDEGAASEDFPAEHALIRELGIYADDLIGLLGKRNEVLEVVEAFL